MSLMCPNPFDISNLIELIFGSSVAIEVAPEQLIATAEQMEAKISSVRGKFDEMTSTMNGTKNYWEGKVSDSRNTRFTNNAEQMQEMFSLLNSYVVKLKTIAENYINTEDKNETTAEALPFNIIS